jgi:hypothetical protein
MRASSLSVLILASAMRRVLVRASGFEPLICVCSPRDPHTKLPKHRRTMVQITTLFAEVSANDWGFINFLVRPNGRTDLVD